MSLVKHSVDSDGLATVWLNDPDRRNAMSPGMAGDFAQTVAQLKTKDPPLRAVILTGEGTAFAAGGDLGMLQDKIGQNRQINRQSMLDFYESFLSILQLPVPIIAAVNGHAIGAGFCLALACDLRVAASEAKLALNFVRLGLHPGMGATLLLPRLVGHAQASDLLLSGRTVSANCGPLSGVFHSIVPASQVLSAARVLAESLLHGESTAIAETLATLRPQTHELQTALEREADMQGLDFERDEIRERLSAAMDR